MPSMQIFNGKVEESGIVLGNTDKQREANYQFKKFSEKLKQYVLQKCQNLEDIIILVRYKKINYTQHTKANIIIH